MRTESAQSKAGVPQHTFMDSSWSRSGVRVSLRNHGGRGEDASVDAMSGKKRQAKLNAIKEACQKVIGGDLLARLSEALAR